QPLLWELIEDASNLRVLDLGCGDARIAKNFKFAGAQSYLGIEASQKMSESALSNMEPGFSDIKQAWLEDYDATIAYYDLIISSLAFHYVEDLKPVFLKANQALKPGGRFIFSVEHPIITSCQKSMEDTPVREAWLVDNYFVQGPRTVNWMSGQV